MVNKYTKLLNDENDFEDNTLPIEYTMNGSYDSDDILPTNDRCCVPFHKLFVTFLSDLMKIGRKLTVNDLTLDVGCRSDENGRLFLAHWTRSNKSSSKASSYRIFRLVLRRLVHRWFYISWLLFIVTGLLAIPAVAVCTSRMISLYSEMSSGAGDSSASVGLVVLYALAILFIELVGGLSEHGFHVVAMEADISVRAAIRAAVFRHAVRQDHVPDGLATVLVGDDSMFISQSLFHTFNIPYMILRALLTFATVYQFVGGPATLAAVTVTLLLVPCCYLGMNLIFSNFQKVRRLKDERASILSEILTNIQTIKLYAWETVVCKRVNQVRVRELQKLKKCQIGVAAVTFFFESTASIICIAVLCVYGLTTESSSADAFRPEIIFPVLNLVKNLAWPLTDLPESISALTSAFVSMKRLDSFLCQTTLTAHTPWHSSVKRSTVPAAKTRETNDDEAIVVLKQATFAWPPMLDVWGETDGSSSAAATSQASLSSSSSSTAVQRPSPSQFNDDRLAAPVLPCIDLSIAPGELVAIVGPVGAGKSALLRALIGEMELVSGPSSFQCFFDTGAVADDPVETAAAGPAFVPQQAYIKNGTLIENVLLGAPFEPSAWDRATAAVGLDLDIALFPGGASVQLGERGVTLSGGQKQRVSLCRLAYRVALGGQWANEIAFCALDDPVSAVDARVANQILTKLLSRTTGLLKRKTVVFVTHRLSLLPDCDRVVVMELGGRITHCGHYNELVRQGFNFQALQVLLAPAPEATTTDEATTTADEATITAAATATDEAAAADDAVTEWQTKIDNAIAATPSSPASHQRSLKRTSVILSSSHDSFYNGLSSSSCPPSPLLRHREQQDSVGAFGDGVAAGCDAGAALHKPSNDHHDVAEKLIQDEEEENGFVGLGVVFAFLRIGTGRLIHRVLLVLSIIGQQAGEVAQVLWLGYWTSTAAAAAVSLPLTPFLAPYISFGVFVALATLVRYVVTALATVRLGKHLHESMLEKLVQASAQFFVEQPSGRLINRFTNDLGFIDTWFLDALSDFCSSSLRIVRPLITIVILAPFSFFIFVPLILVFLKLNKRFQPVSMELSRLDSLSSSPVFSSLLSALNGSKVLRSFSCALQVSMNQFHLMNDRSSASSISFLTGSRWLLTRTWILGNFTLFFLSVYLALSPHLPPFMQANLKESGVFLALFASISWAMGESSHIFSRALNGFNRFERSIGVLKTPTEPRSFIPAASTGIQSSVPPFKQLTCVPDFCGKKQGDDDDDHSLAVVVTEEPPANWPSRGKLEFRSVCLRYSKTGPDVLKNLSFTIEPGEKVGIVGRTGAGKSSIANALFLLYPVHGGDIVLDGVSLLNLRPQLVRQSIAIIPQDPMIFQGSVRMNLGGSSSAASNRRVDDATLWNALDAVGIGSIVRQMDGGLDAFITHDRISLGQRQQFCLARALIRDTRLIFLDEATSSIDPQADNLMQIAVRTIFAGRTIITIAHRLSTIMDYDRIMVMEQGKLVEFESPAKLLQDPNSMFSKLISMSNK